MQYEFTWTPGYHFVQEVQKQLITEVTFFTLDKSNNRAQRKVKIKVLDAENMIEKDALQYTKYRNNLIAAMMLISQLDDNQKELNSDYKKARKGKQHRSILNASSVRLPASRPWPSNPTRPRSFPVWVVQRY